MTAPARQTPGVNLVGFLDEGFGLGEVARKLARALEYAGIPYAAIPYRRGPGAAETERLKEVPAPAAPFDTNLICLNADDLHPFLAEVGADFFAGRYSIGVWFWESSVFRPENLAGFRFLDEVWVASEYVRRAVAAESDIPVHLLPLPVEAPAPPARTRAELGLPEGFLFLFLFDFVSAQRKNPGAVVEAFTRAFESEEGPVLLLKSVNGRERKPRLLEELMASTADRPDIHVVDAYVSAEKRDATIAACDCYVSLHRSEGFGLTMAEAMAHGKPVIATGYSGNLEFMNDRNSYLVPCRLTPVPRDWWAWTPGAEWAEPEVDAAVAYMREVYGDREAARERGERGRASILGAMSVDRTAEFVAGRLEDAPRRPGVSREEDPRAAILQASHELSRGVGASLTSSRRGSGIVRRLAARALWPYLEDQHRLNTMTLDALATLQRSVDELGRRLAEIEARDSGRPRA